MYFLKESKVSLIISALTFIVLGLVLCIWPQTAMNFICIVAGAALLIGGAWQIIAYLRGKAAAGLAPGSFVSDITPLREKLKSAIPGYELSPEYFLTKGLNLHIKLFPRHSAADINARNYNQAARLATGLDATTMPAFNEDLTAICGLADMSHNQKVRR